MELIKIIEEILMLEEEQKLIEIELQNYIEEIRYIEKLVLEAECIKQQELEFEKKYHRKELK